MEVLGAVASSIAVLQALAAGKHVVNLIREIPDIQSDFDNLMKELGLIRSMTEVVSGMPSTPLVQGLIKSATDDLERILGELDTLLQSCAREIDQQDKKVWRTRKRKWLFEGSNIRKLQQRMANAKNTLLLAITSSQTSNNAQLQAEMHQLSTSFCMMHMELRSVIKGSQTGKSTANQASSQLETDTGAATSVMTISSEGDNISPVNELVRVQSRTFIPQAPYVSSFKLLDTASYLWDDQRRPSWVIRRSVIDYDVYPDDSDVTGQGLMQYALSQNLYPAIEVLLDVWKNILPEIGLPRGVAYAAMDLLRNFELNDHEIYIVSKTLSFVKDQPEVTMTKVHMALAQGTDLHEALQEQPWAIDMIDDTGYAPLHIAAIENQSEAVGMLIDAGANVDQQTHDGYTALMSAVRQENVEIVKVLIKAKCSVNMTSQEGRTALHMAAKKNTPELVGLLLAAGASARHRDNFGDTALHKIARYSRASLDNMKTIIETLVMAGADIEARDIQGGTPMLQAILYDNTTARDSWGDTPWDEFIDVTNTDEWYIVDRRKPSPAEQEAFVGFYQGARDRNLQHDIDGLGGALSALLEQDAATAREHLAPLIKKEKDWKRDTLVSWYQAVDMRIQHLEWDLGVEDVEGYIADLREELDTPVWKIPSEYGYLWDNNDEDLVIGEEWEDSDELEEETSDVEEESDAEEETSDVDECSAKERGV
ncbi:hypothetical protein FSARC_7289 [Fusarium sarcochroum]|uniref:Fungal N-terminal domain-containing protein n=1 Tax=Fusarium sarcochroum TaxID=1208366 RepID=A0A8H4TVM7_9HYPO|nr:hypothetical protein FSARC_7289 [Fusarium sarcochroum]